jgi:hypothetical protein
MGMGELTVLFEFNNIQSGEDKKTSIQNPVRGISFPAGEKLQVEFFSTKYYHPRPNPIPPNRISLKPVNIQEDVLSDSI